MGDAARARSFPGTSIPDVKHEQTNKKTHSCPPHTQTAIIYPYQIDYEGIVIQCSQAEETATTTETDGSNDW